MVPLSDAAKRRAGAADPNNQRCLIENCPPERAVEPVHVFARERSQNLWMMYSMEWNMGLRKGTLNLDTRHNIIFFHESSILLSAHSLPGPVVGASLHALYKAEKWGLMPEESIIDQYLNKREHPLRRERLPKNGLFQYQLIPIRDMEAIGITRQNEHGGFTNHVYPFTTFTSHIHPTFAIKHIASCVRQRTGDHHTQQLIKDNRLVRDCLRLYIRWVAGLMPPRVKTDLTFVDEPVETREDEILGKTDDVDCSLPVSDNDSTATPPRRLQCTEPEVFPRRGKGKSKKVKRQQVLTHEDRDVSEAPSAWTNEDIVTWARDSAPSPPPESSLEHNQPVARG